MVWEGGGGSGGFGAKLTVLYIFFFSGRSQTKSTYFHTELIIKFCDNHYLEKEFYYYEVLCTFVLNIKALNLHFLRTVNLPCFAEFALYKKYVV